MKKRRTLNKASVAKGIGGAAASSSRSTRPPTNAPVWLEFSEQWTTGDVINYSLHSLVDPSSPNGYTTYVEASDSPNSLSTIGLSLSTWGVITGTIPALTGGTYTFYFDATNPEGTTKSSLSVLIVALEIVAPTFDITDDKVVQDEQAFSFDVSTYMTNDGDPSGPSFVTYSVTGASLTALTSVGLSLNEITGVISGTLSGTLSITEIFITATNAADLSTTSSFNLTVNAAPATATPQVVDWFTGNLSCTVVVVPTWSDTGDTWSIEAVNDADAKTINLLSEANAYLAYNGGSAITSVNIAATYSLPPNWTLDEDGADGYGIGILYRGAVANADVDDTTVKFTATNSAGTSADSAEFNFNFWTAAAAPPTLDYVTADNDSSLLYLNFSEAVTAADWTTGVSVYINDAAKSSPYTITYSSGTGTTRIAYTVTGHTFTPNNTIVVDVDNATVGITSVATSAAVADASDITYVIPTAPTTGVIFSDNFNDGSLNIGVTQDNGFYWKVPKNVTVSTDNPKDGTHSVKMTFPGGSAHSHSELPFNIGGHYPDLWVRYDIFVPSNFVYRPAVSNGKLALFWEGVYSGFDLTGPLLGAEMWRQSDGRAKATPRAKVHDGATTWLIDRHYHDDGGFMIDTPDKGKWTTHILNLKYATNATSNDGHIKMWKIRDNILYQIINLTGESFYVPGQQGMDQGYLLGWVNGGFDEDTVIYIDNFVIGTESLL